MERFNPCTTDACTKQCDSMGVRCEEVCIDEIERLREVFRVNMLRLAPETSHEEIDRVLNGEPHH